MRVCYRHGCCYRVVAALRFLSLQQSKNTALCCVWYSLIKRLAPGLWKWSRHPNYLGEQLWWWGLAGFAIGLRQPWAVAGTLFNTLCMVGFRILQYDIILQLFPSPFAHRDNPCFPRYCVATVLLGLLQKRGLLVKIHGMRLLEKGAAAMGHLVHVCE